MRVLGWLPYACAPACWGEQRWCAGALRECEEALAADPDDRVAANNCAVCKMYCCNLPGAIQVCSHSHAHEIHATLQKARMTSLHNRQQSGCAVDCSTLCICMCNVQVRDCRA